MDLFAYLDPGSASALLAAVLAGVAGIGAAFRSYGKRFMSVIMFWKKDEPAVDGPAASEEPASDSSEQSKSSDS
ncbi:MAG: hypothetical protein M9938_00375 [Solirubrobacterales bacterium]|nr:hypothetical protein [Solirubrobacterales bacterium]